MRGPELGEWVHLVGIGGSGMSGLGRYFKRMGKRVTGSDCVASETLEALQREGIPVFIGHREENLGEGVSMVVHSAAVPRGIPDVAAAERKGIPVHLYCEALGMISRGKKVIAVAGTHGKTTTAALIAHILVLAGKDPSFIIGGESSSLGGNGRCGSGDFFVLEACEYRRSFHSLNPLIAVVTNVEEDHLDYYLDRAEIEEAFRFFIQKVPRGGHVILDSELAAHLLPSLLHGRRVETFGISNRAHWRALDIQNEGIQRSFLMTRKGKEIGRVKLQIPGDFNVGNALAAAAAAYSAGVKFKEILNGLCSFPGVLRRFEIKMDNRILMVDDYAHHPTEIRVVLKTLRGAFPKRRLLCLFQPHQHSRTRIFLNELAESFLEADEVIVSPIYRARDNELEWNAVKGSDLAKAIQERKIQAGFFPDLESCLSYIEKGFKEDSVLVTLGAGDIFRVANELVRRFSAPS